MKAGRPVKWSWLFQDVFTRNEVKCSNESDQIRPIVLDNQFSRVESKANEQPVSLLNKPVVKQASKRARKRQAANTSSPKSESKRKDEWMDVCGEERRIVVCFPCWHLYSLFRLGN